MKSEQAPKVLMRMPTRLHFGEGRVGGEAIDRRTRFDPPGYWARHVGKVIRVIRGDPFWGEGSGLAGGGKDPDFRRAFEDDEGKVIGDEPYNTGKDPDPSEKAVS